MSDTHPIESLDAGAQPITPSPAPAPAPAPARDRSTIQGELLDVTNQLLDNTDWTQREGLREKRGKLYGELEALKRKDAPLYDEKKLAAAERKDAPAEEQQQTAEGEGYKLEVPTDLNQEQQEIAQGYAEEVGVLAQAAGIPHAEAEVLLHHAFDLDLRGPEGITGSNPTECISVLTNRYGKEAAGRMIADSVAAVRRLGPSVKAYLEQTNEAGDAIGNLPSVVAALSAWHRGDMKLSPAEASKQLTRLRASKEYMAGDHATVDRVALLHKLAARGQSNELEMPKRGAAPSPTAQDRVQAQLDKLRRDPAYFSKDHANHAEVTAQVAKLYQQLHGSK